MPIYGAYSKVHQGVVESAKAQEQHLRNTDADNFALEKQIQELRQQSNARVSAIEKEVQSLQRGKKDK